MSPGIPVHPVSPYRDSGISWLDVSGRVDYYSCDELHSQPPNPRPVPEVEVSALGCADTHSVSILSNASGQYAFRLCEDCDYCIRAHKESAEDITTESIPAITMPRSPTGSAVRTT